MDLPYPPVRLMERVGGPAEGYDDLGSTARRDFLALTPPSFTWDGAYVLDFGCGAGRVLRQFDDEVTRAAEFWGCDIDAESVEWAQANLCPPFRVIRNDLVPPLPFEDETFDLVYSLSVFTHLGETWSAWLHELHRILKPGGMLLATTLGPGAELELGRPWDEDRIGMLVTIPDETFVDSSGPVVFHSEWWIREHWGRAFDVVEYWPSGFGLGGPGKVALGQGCAALRKRDVVITVEDLERPSDDRREWLAMAENLAVLHERERAWKSRAQRVEAELDALTGTRSWRLARGIARIGRPFARRPDPA